MNESKNYRDIKMKFKLLNLSFGIYYSKINVNKKVFRKKCRM